MPSEVGCIPPFTIKRARWLRSVSDGNKILLDGIVKVSNKITERLVKDMDENEVDI